MCLARPTIGLTFFLRKDGGSIWENGATQQCVFLLHTLRASKQFAEVIAINAGDAETTPPGLMLKDLGIEFVKPEAVVDRLDVLIEAHGQVSPEHVERVHARGGKTIGYKFGNAFVIDGERMIHGKPCGGIFNGARFDEIWTIPQHMTTCASYWETMYRAPVRCMPHVWEPLFLDAAIKEFPAGCVFGYKPGARPKRIGIFEPNLNMVKTAFVPLLAVELAHRQRPSAIGDVYVTNAMHLKEHLTFKHMASQLDIFKTRKASCEGRFNTPYFLAQHCDIMVSHQWECALNYAYYDAMYGGYPLVHNADLLPRGVGYRYEGFDCQDGARAILEAVDRHDARIDQYRAQSNAFLATVHATAPRNVEAHERALAELCERRAAA